MSLQRIAGYIEGRKAEQGEFLSPIEATQRAAEEILEGFRDPKEAQEHAQGMAETGNVTFTSMGYEVNAKTLKAAVYFASTGKHPFNHEQVVNRADRQTCCRFCHTCHSLLREVLDGELWCDKCQGYQ